MWAGLWAEGIGGVSNGDPTQWGPKFFYSAAFLPAAISDDKVCKDCNFILLVA